MKKATGHILPFLNLYKTPCFASVCLNKFFCFPPFFSKWGQSPSTFVCLTWGGKIVQRASFRTWMLTKCVYGHKFNWPNFNFFQSHRNISHRKKDLLEILLKRNLSKILYTCANKILIFNLHSLQNKETQIDAFSCRRSQISIIFFAWEFSNF